MVRVIHSMRMKTNQPDAGSMRMISFCPLCDARYSGGEARVLSEKEDTRLVHTTCQSCGAFTIALVVETEDGGSAAGLVTDLSHEDVLRFQRGRKLTTDDVIDTHEGLGLPLAELLRVPLPKRRAKAPAKARTRSKRHV